MGTHYHQLDQGLRDRIAALKREGHSNRAIADVLGISHTTIGRELERNRYGTDGRTPMDKHGLYDSEYANHQAYTRRKYAKYQGKKIHENHRLQSFIITNVKLHWNPDEMAGYMKKHWGSLGFYASKTAIYEWFDTVYGERYQSYLYAHRDGRKPRRKREGSATHIPERVDITERPQAAEDRKETGHYEFDSVVSGKTSGSTAALAVIQERSTRLLCAQRVTSLAPGVYACTIAHMVRDHRSVLSLTTDNGLENRQWKTITEATGATVYFTAPYSSYQKGGVEHGNKMLRRYFPKGTDFAVVSQRQVYDAILRINKKPRRCLGYTSSLQLAKEEGVLP